VLFPESGETALRDEKVEVAMISRSLGGSWEGGLENDLENGRLGGVDDWPCAGELVMEETAEETSDRLF